MEVGTGRGCEQYLVEYGRMISETNDRFTGLPGQCGEAAAAAAVVGVALWPPCPKVICVLAHFLQLQ